MVQLEIDIRIVQSARHIAKLPTDRCEKQILSGQLRSAVASNPESLLSHLHLERFVINYPGVCGKPYRFILLGSTGILSSKEVAKYL